MKSVKLKIINNQLTQTVINHGHLLAFEMCISLCYTTSLSHVIQPTLLTFSRNISTGRQTPKVGSFLEHSSTNTENHEGADKPLHNDTSVGGSNPAEKNRNCINYEWQQAQSRQSGTESSSPTPVSESCNATQPPPVGNSGPLCAQLTREDLETLKLDPSEVQRNLRESSDESLMEHSQKEFCSPEKKTSHSPFYPLTKMASEVSGSQGSSRAADTSITILPKQQNVPKRPSSLSLHAKPSGKTPTSSSSSLRMKFGKLGKSNLKKVETGVAKASVVSTAHEARPITVANNDAVTAVNKAPEPAGCPANAADVHWNGAMSSEDLTFGLLNTSPDEQEPLLRRDAHPDNANNNNSNNNNGEGEGDGDTEDGEGGENSESVGPTGDAPLASTVEPVALPGPCPAPTVVPPQAQTQAQTHGEALLRQNRVRRPERPNSLDLSITTLPLLGEY